MPVCPPRTGQADAATQIWKRRGLGRGYGPHRERVQDQQWDCGASGPQDPTPTGSVQERRDTDGFWSTTQSPLPGPPLPPRVLPGPPSPWPGSQPCSQLLSGALGSLQGSHSIKRSPLCTVQNLRKQLATAPVPPTPPWVLWPWEAQAHNPSAGAPWPWSCSLCRPGPGCSGLGRSQSGLRQCGQLPPYTASPPLTLRQA